MLYKECIVKLVYETKLVNSQ